MNIIPVIDLLNGVVVHAKKGQRDHYLPIASSLTSSIKAVDIVKAFLEIYPFNSLYIADLNAIQKKEKIDTTNYTVIESIKLQFPELTIWLDAGINCKAELNIWNKLNIKLILASECFTTIGDYASLSSSYKKNALSLDFFADGYVGPSELISTTEYWPLDIIVMTLASVGTNQGVNKQLLNDILVRSKGFNVYAAGGIRNIDDLLMLKEMQVAGALIATALHEKQISSNDIQLLMT